MKHGRWPGTWKIICDVCGFEFASDQVKKRWDNLYVCFKDWESRHPQDLIRGVKDEPSVPFARPEPPDDFSASPQCYLYATNAYADLAEADCAQADITTFSYTYLLELKGP